MENLLGKVLCNRYRIDASLGRGGMAEVYKAWDQERATYLALKVLRQDLSRDAIFLRRFQREAQTLEKLKHPNIVRFYGIESDDLIVFMLMDYIEGSTLQDEIFRARGTPLHLGFVGTVLNAVNAALHYAHRQGLVHCDIKPGNIMIEKSGRVLLTDFGIARMTDAATATMVGFGTPAYMAPELVRGKDPTPQSDIYSLGVVLYEMVTGGERPFTGERAKATGSTSEKVRWEQVHLEPPSPLKYTPTLSPDLETIIFKCLQKDPHFRYVNSFEILQAVESSSLKSQASGAEDNDGVYLGKKNEVRRDLAKSEVGNADVKKKLVKGPDSSRDVPVGKKKENAGSKKLPSWLPWGILGLLAVVLVMVLVLGDRGDDENGENLAMEVNTATVTMTLTPTEALDVGSTRINEKDGAEMVFVPAGEFLMGSEDSDANNDEDPEHSVYLDAYWIYKHEVTNAQYRQCIEAVVCKGALNRYPEDNYPAIFIDWNEANDYCKWEGGRIPTEAEWEKAARGVDGRTYPWGEEEPTCNLTQFYDCPAGAVQVGRFPNGASLYGSLDMAGNVWEWVGDWYDEDYYTSSPRSNPTGPGNGNYRVLRGGSWSSDEGSLRTSYRGWNDPLDTYFNIGFRCAHSFEP